MNIFVNYTKKNILTNKMRASLLVLTIVLSCMVFFLSLVTPKYLSNFHESTMRRYFGNSDIYLEMNDSETLSSIADMNDIPDEISSQFEYCYGFIGAPSSYKDPSSNKEVSIELIAGNFDDMQAFNPVTVLSGNTSDFVGRKAIVTKKMAKQFDWEVGDTTSFGFAGVNVTFRVVAIVAAEGLMSETNGNVVFLSKAGVGEIANKVYPSIDIDKINSLFNICVIKTKENADITGIANGLASTYPSYTVQETVNNEKLESTVKMLTYPFVVCVALVCLFCVFIIYLTCKLTFSERIRQFATLKSLGATTKNLLFSLLLESAFYGLMGGLFGALTSLLEVYLFPIMFPAVNYITPVSFWYYLITVLFGVFIAIASSFIQALKNARKSIKQTMLKQPDSPKQNVALSIVFGTLAVIGLTLMFSIRKYIPGANWVSIIIFFLSLVPLLMIIPFILKGIHMLFKAIFKKQTFESQYISRTIMTKNVSVANRLLFFGVLLVFIFSILITSINSWLATTESYNYTIAIGQVNSSDEDVFEYAKSIKEVEYAWKCAELRELELDNRNVFIDRLFGVEDSAYTTNYKSLTSNYDEVMKRFNDNDTIVLNDYFQRQYGYKVGDKIKLSQGSSIVSEFNFEIIGFFSGYERYGNEAICNISIADKVPSIDKFNQIMIRTNDGVFIDDVINNIRNHFSTEMHTYTNRVTITNHFLKQIEPAVFLIEIYSTVIMILCLLCIFIGYLLYLKEQAAAHSTLYLLGMSPMRFLKLISIQALFMAFFTIALAVIEALAAAIQAPFIFAVMGINFYVTINWIEIIIYSIAALVGTIFVALVLSAWFKRDLTNASKRTKG